MDAASMLTLLTALLHLFGNANGSGCTFISEERDTCYISIECSLTLEGFEQALQNHHCTEKKYKQTYNPYYGSYSSSFGYVREFKINLSLKSFNFEEHLLFSPNDLASRIKILKIHNSKGATINNIKKSEMTTLNEIEVHSVLDTLNFNNFLDYSQLKRIDVSQSSISSLETDSESTITSNSKATIIDLSHNVIEVIPNNYFLHFPELRDLNLSHNKLKSFELLTFEGLLNLQKLKLSYNELGEIGHNFARFINLNELQIDNNQLNSIVQANFRTMAKLQILNISSNRIGLIESDSFETLHELNMIDLGDNKISTVSKEWFANNSKLHTVILSNNEIKSVEVGAFNEKNITTFDIENNCLTGDLETGTFKGIHIDQLDLSNGKLTRINDDAFDLSSIQMLNLSLNSIQNVSKNAFRSLDMLSELDLSHNFLKFIDIEMIESNNLSVLRAQNNTIASISQQNFKNLSSLSYLDLSYNSIAKLESDSFVNLKKRKTLALNNNKLQNKRLSGVFRGLTEVTEITLAFSRITHLENETFNGLINLQTLNISHNELTNLDYNVFIKTGSLKTLDFSNNLLNVFEVNTSTILFINEIRLNNNQIKQISPTTFSDLAFLHTLDLSRNNLKELKKNDFHSLKNLNYLDLSFNTHLEVNGSVFSNLTRLIKVVLRNVKGHIDFAHASNTSIDVLDLSQCDISEINNMFVYNIADVQNLILSSNKITRLDKFSFQTMSKLSELDLSDNRISYIQPGTFISTNKIRSLNLHGNLLTHLQFGVLDGLQILHNLNMSSNILREFSSSLLHKTPLIDTIALDNNVIKVFKFAEFDDTSIKVISIGRNQISCNILTQVKKEIGHQIHKFMVKTEVEDYHSENVEGITCISDTLDNKILRSFNDTNINSTLFIAALSNAIEVFRVSIERLNQNLNSSNKTTTDSDNKQILNKLNESNNYLKQLTDTSVITNNDTKKLYSVMKDLLMNFTLTNKKNTERIIYVKANETNLVDDHLLEKIKILNEQKDKMVDELKYIINEFKLENNHNSKTQALQETRNDNSDTKGVLYFIAVCLTMIIVGFACKIAYPFVVSRNRLIRGSSPHNSVSSTLPISNVLEMQ